MKTSLLDLLLRGKHLAEPPSIWGKLPSHGDYVRHRVSVEEAHAWQKWTHDIWLQRPMATAGSKGGTQHARSGENAQRWTQLDASVSTPSLDSAPIAFVMVPGKMSFCTDDFLQGVMIDSYDKVGRTCPLIVYQRVSRAWAIETWYEAAKGDGRHVLFWLSRLAARIHDEDFEIGNLSDAVDRLWDMHRPGWRQYLGAQLRQPDAQAIEAWLKTLGTGLDEEIAKFKGVRHLPWADWPGRLFRSRHTQSAYWVQDLAGRYVLACDDVLKLRRGKL